MSLAAAGGSCRAKAGGSGLTDRLHPVVVGAVLAFAAAVLLVTWDPDLCITGDGTRYVSAGINLMQGRGYVDVTGKPETVFSPLYPIAIGLVWRFFRLSPEMAGRLVSAMAALVSILLVYLIGRALLSKWFGALAAFVYTLMPIRSGSRLGWPLTQSVLSESLYVALTLAAVLAWLAFERRGRLRAALAVGLFAALGWLTRPEGVTLLALFVLRLVLRRGVGWGGRLAVPAATISLAFLVSFPYLTFLHRHTGHWALTSKVDANVRIAALAAARVPWTQMRQIEGGQATMASEEELLRRYPHLRVSLSPPRRWLHNTFEAVDAMGWLFTPIELILAGIGLLVVPWTLRRLKMEMPLIATWAYLPVCVAFYFHGRFLFPVGPAMAVWAAAGITWLAESGLPKARVPGRGTRISLPAVIALLVFLLLAGRLLRSEVTQACAGPADPHRSAGEWMCAHDLTGGVMATTAAVGFYAKQRPIGLPYAPTDQLIAYAAKRKARWLAVTSWDQTIHPDLLPLLRARSGAPGLRLVSHGQTRGTPAGQWCVWRIEHP